MVNQRLSYSLFSVALALAVLASVSLPTGLHAFGMDAFCVTDIEHQDEYAGYTHMGECELSDDMGSGPGYFSQKGTNCVLSISCACRVTVVPVNAEAVTPSVKMDVVLPSSVHSFAPELLIAGVPRGFKQPLRKTALPPLYILNASFLN